MVNLLPHHDLAWLPGIKQFVGLDIPEKAFGKLASFITPIIDDHKKTYDEDSHRYFRKSFLSFRFIFQDFPRDFLDLMLSQQMKADPSSSFHGKMGYYTIINDYIELFFAGMETTASSLMWCFLYLLHHPGKDVFEKYNKLWTFAYFCLDIQARIHSEIDDVVGKERLPSLDDKNEMHYTQAFLLESLRYVVLLYTFVL